MRSFGLWYKNVNVVEDTKKNENSHKSIDTEKVKNIFDIHINFWSESVKKDSKVPNLDVGIKIKNFKTIEKLIFHCPFIIKKDELVDLASKLQDKKNADLIFNTDGEITTKELFYLYSFKKKEKEEEKLLLFCLTQNLAEICLSNSKDNKTDIIFNFSRFNTYIKKRDVFNDINDMYIRFRITSNELENNIYFDSELSNKSFDSAFSGTRIFDFKINEKRNLGTDTITNISVGDYVFPQIDKIHLLVMERASYEVQSFTNVPMTCRELEGKLWNEYFGSSIESSKNRILAYHWKFEKECSCLIKVKYSKTNLIILMVYMLMLLALGMLSSTIVAFIQNKCNNGLLYIAIVCITFIISGLYVGRKKH